MNTSKLNITVRLFSLLFLLTALSAPSIAAPFPRVYLQTSATVVAPKGSIRLTWTTQNVSRCEARGDWYGRREVRGGWNLNGLERNHEYRLVCYGPGGTASDSVSVRIGSPEQSTAPPAKQEPEEPPPRPSGSQPAATLQASAASIL
jgi:hypothetical protein